MTCGAWGNWRAAFDGNGKLFWIRPFPWRGIRARLKRFIGKDADVPVFPQWLNRSSRDA